MAYLVSALLDHLDVFHPHAEGVALHGANLTNSFLLRSFCQDPEVEAVEAFIPPGLMAQTDKLAEAAEHALPPELRGRGRLRFYPLHSLPDVWKDALPRVLFAQDAIYLTRTRYVRDCYALGPTAITAISHSYGCHRMWPVLQRVADVPPVDFDSIICLSESNRRVVEKIFRGFLGPEDAPIPCRLDVIPHSVDVARFRPRSAEEKMELRRELGLPTDAVITLFLGRVTAVGKADLLPLMDAFAQASGPRDVLVVAGRESEKGYHDRLRVAAHDAGISARYIGHEDVPAATRERYFGAADVFVFPGDCIQECQGSTALEAMASGLPVVCSDWDGMKDLVDHGRTGLRVPTWIMPCQERLSGLSPVSSLATDYLLMGQTVCVDPEALTDALRGLLRSPERRAEMGIAGREKAAGKYAWTCLLSSWHTVWDELLAEARREATEQAQSRREHAHRVGLPTPYLYLFDHYATGVIKAETQAFRLTDAGRAVADGSRSLALYDDTLALLHPDVLDGLLAALGAAGRHGAVLNDVVRNVAKHTGHDGDAIRFHAALLLKRGAIAPCPSPPLRSEAA